MIYEIKKYGSTVLRDEAQNVEKIDEEIKEILENMVGTMYATKGVGLAAPQIGVSKRMFVCDKGDGNVRKIINPVITPLTDELAECEEGCLSVPGIYKKVRRPSKIKIEYTNVDGEKVEEILDDFLAIIMQHEYDHLDGVLFVDKVSPIAKRMIFKKLQNLKKETKKAEQAEE
ncbi:Peptide deformylase [Fusobacterium sp. DD29]|uniref:peptide deformylase n=1 Tax=unclassified Fusobacterium TaxID=2648384 RepID=UPI001B8B6813|nr:MULTISPECIES: peptide deformylase [unclassified Fusobacterium]MBR8749330.1 Peptide deformylase [Fusobacterium sp. DD29]MBR8761596.1 Peptide deformylase [Fusobacterium sp. DD25]MBR8767609.1 Peptide deformylase [Fusobacterium sp. DD43]MBR8771684.1 Peptide deformylase [Fusobacterium sp. DD40]MBR8775910.1 Peptide deformylase [Fusobacterium sp. DD17]